MPLIIFVKRSSLGFWIRLCSSYKNHLNWLKFFILKTENIFKTRCASIYKTKKLFALFISLFWGCNCTWESLPLPQIRTPITLRLLNTKSLWFVSVFVIRNSKFSADILGCIATLFIILVPDMHNLKLSLKMQRRMRNLVRRSFLRKQFTAESC